jgi:hypothetical protein
MSIQGTPFVELRELVAQAVYGTQRVTFYILENQEHQIIIGMARRVQDKAKLERFARVAGDDEDTWNRDERETIECLVGKQQVGRAEEWILSRLIKKRGTDAFRDATGASGTPFTSISHSTKAIVVSFSDAPAGIDHEVVEARDPIWALKMDPERETIPLGRFLGTWRQLSKNCLETIAWASKEASMKAWGINRLGLLPGIKVSGSGESIITRALSNEKKEVQCRVFLAVDATGVLAIALPVST